MDIFGIGHAMKAMSHIYFQSARQSGRTMMMIDNLKPGDRIVFANQREADRVERLIRERAQKDNRFKDIRCLVCSPGDVHDLRQFGTSQGRTVFDHTLVESMYLNAIDACEKNIEFMQKDLSGPGLRYPETKRQKFESDKWRTF